MLVSVHLISPIAGDMMYLLITVENSIQISVAEDNLAAHKTVRFRPRDLLPAGQQGIVDEGGAELGSELLVVDSLDLSVFTNFTGHGPRVDILPMGLGSTVCRWCLWLLIGRRVCDLSHNDR